MKHSPEDHTAVSQARVLLCQAAAELDKFLRKDPELWNGLQETPARVVMESVSASIQAALDRLDTMVQDSPSKPPLPPGGPTRQQGQFLAYIQQYMRSNYSGAAPTHAVLQKFFNLTPPSVNSMLIRLEQRGFIRRIPGQARGIHLTISPERIPPLERPFKV